MLGMHLFFALLFLTLVGTPSWAAAPAESSFVEQERRQDDLRIQEGMRRPEVWGMRKVPRSDQRLQLHAGFLSGSFFEKDQNQDSPFLGVGLVQKKTPSLLWDLSADVATSSWLRLNAGQRHRIGLDRGTMPYARWGLSQTVKTSNFPAGLVDLSNLKLSGGVGFSNLFDENEHWNMQFDLQYGLKGPALQFSLGWNIDL